MPAKCTSIPKLHHHKGSGQALVVIDGRSIYLGKYGTTQAQEQYDRVIAEWLSNGRRVDQNAPGLTVAETILAYWSFAQTYYRKNGEATDELYGIKAAMRPLRKAYASLPVADFGPLKLKAVRQTMIDAGHIASIGYDHGSHVPPVADATILVREGMGHELPAIRGEQVDRPQHHGQGQSATAVSKLGISVGFSIASTPCQDRSDRRHTQLRSASAAGFTVQSRRCQQEGKWATRVGQCTFVIASPTQASNPGPKRAQRI